MGLMLKSILNHQAEIEKHEKAIEKIIANCVHEEKFLEKKYGANTGGYDGPMHDSYWADFTCTRCGKSWRADRKENPNEYYLDVKVV